MRNIWNVKNQSRPDLLYVMICAAVFLAEAFLAWRQSVRYGGGYMSDVSLYVKIARRNPTPTRAVNWLFAHLMDLCGNTLGIAILLGLAVSLTIVANYLLLRYLFCSRFPENGDRLSGAGAPGFRGTGTPFPEAGDTATGCCADASADRRLLEAASVAALFSGPVYIPQLMPYFYEKTLSKYAWQSPTQIMMMPLAILALLLFFRIRERYFRRIAPGQWLLLSLAFLASAWAKPSFIMIFYPLMAAILLRDLIFGRRECGSVGRRFRSVLILGCSALPGMVYFLYLNKAMFGGASGTAGAGASEAAGAAASAAASGGDGSVIIQFGRAYFNQDFSVPLSLLAGLLFPLLVLLFNLPALRDIRYASGWLLLLIGIAEHFTFSETGRRAAHGNFAWGKKAGAYLLFLLSIWKFAENCRDPQFLQRRPELRRLYFVLGFVLLGLHVACQLYYFQLLLRGHHYMM